MNLFLDVDGVISPMPDHRSPLKHWGDWRKCPNVGFHLLLSQTLADALTELGVTIKWLTTWEAGEMCNEYISPVLGWDRLEVLPRKGCSEEPWWKLDAILRHGLTEPFIWIDDDIHYAEDAVAKAFKEAKVTVPRMLVSPDWEEGITPAMVEEMRMFVREHS